MAVFFLNLFCLLLFIGFWSVLEKHSSCSIPNFHLLVAASINVTITYPWIRRSQKKGPLQIGFSNFPDHERKNPFHITLNESNPFAYVPSLRNLMFSEFLKDIATE